MAKKKRRAVAAAAPRASWLTCSDYKLTMNNSDTSFIFELNVRDAGGNPFYLRVKRPNDRTGLLQRTVRTIAERWPAYDWQFQADADGSITDVR